MQNLNYHHLHYFWNVAREGSVRATAAKLHVTPSTISGQLSQLEEEFGDALFLRAAGGMILSEFGEMIFQYAEEIFSTGEELQHYVTRRSSDSFMRLELGVLDAVPKLLVRKLVAPVFQTYPEAHTVFHEGREAELASRLSMHQFDLVLTDSPVASLGAVTIDNRHLGESAIGFFACRELAKSIESFPEDLADAPLLMPQTMTAVRRELDRYFARTNTHPRIVGEFEDTALMKAFGEIGAGIFPAPTVIAAEIERQFDVIEIGVLEEVRESIYLAQPVRKQPHPAVGLIEKLAGEILQP